MSTLLSYCHSFPHQSLLLRLLRDSHISVKNTKSLCVRGSDCYGSSRRKNRQRKARGWSLRPPFPFSSTNVPVALLFLPLCGVGYTAAYIEAEPDEGSRNAR